MPKRSESIFRVSFRHFFFRGLAIVLPTALTIWLVVIAYQFVNYRIAGPINQGVRGLVLHTTDWPSPQPQDYDDAFNQLSETKKEEWAAYSERDVAAGASTTFRQSARRQWMSERDDMVLAARRVALGGWWQATRAMDLIGLVIAIMLIYILGVILTSYVGRRLYSGGEELVNRIPFIRRVYPSVKQVTDFFFGGDKKLQFSQVVAVEYPRKGLWAVGLVTGTTMRMIQDRVGAPCLTVFIPSSPTPFTGYVITVPKAETIDLPISIEDAIKFAVSGGVVVPPNQQIAGKMADVSTTTQPTRIDT